MPTAAEQKLAKASGRPRYFLVLEDNQQHAEILTEMLDLHCAPVVVHTVDSVAGALSLLTENRYDLLLTDGVIRGKSIDRHVRRMMEASHHAPIIVVTGQGNERMAAELTRLGVSEYLVKTREALEMLPSLIKRLLRRRPVASKKTQQKIPRLRAHPPSVAASAMNEINSLSSVIDRLPDIKERDELTARVERIKAVLNKLTGERVS